MNTDQLSGWFSSGFRRPLPVILQTEATECGLACIVMVAHFHGYQSDLATLRRRFSVSLKGVRLTSLIDIAQRLNMATRAVRLDLDDLGNLQLPCILHWQFNHFVVLKAIGRRTLTIVDPARGERTLSPAEFSENFTGVALELWPNPGFEQTEVKQTVRLRNLLGHVTGLYRSLGQILLLALSLEIVSIVSPFYMQWVIDDVIVSADSELLTTLALGFGLLLIVQQGIFAIRSWILIYMGVTLNVQWRANVFSHLLRLPGSYFERRHLGDIASRFASIDVIQRTLTTSFIEAILDGFMTLVTLILIFIYSPILAWITVVAMALYGIGRWGWYRPLRNATEEQIVHAAKQQSHFLETVRGAKTIKLFQGYTQRRAGWLTLLVDQLNADVRTQKLQLFFRLGNGLLFGLENVLIVWLGARLVLDGGFSVGMLMAFLSYKGQFATRVSSLIDKLVEFKMLELQGERLADVVLTEPETAQADGRLLETGKDDLQPSIEIRNLSFQYAEHEPFVLSDINMQIAAGESVAITGPSGGGKTTLVNLMLGVLNPTAGDILVGGTNTKNISLETFRGMVGAVMQDDTLFEGSIADNISFFDVQADQARVEECARLAAIHEDVAAMPMGYNTRVGYLGSVLSGGQKQRVLLARALYKRPKILLLDEATSHLDVARELIVSSSIRALRITRVIVAHRPQTVEMADRVIRLEFCRVAETRRLVTNTASVSEVGMEEGLV